MMQRLSGLDAAFLYVETPNAHMHVSLLAVLEPTGLPLESEEIEALAAQRIVREAAMRKRVLTVPFGIHHPVWVEDPHFDALHHIRRVRCPEPGNQHALEDVVGRINSTPLDRSRPLWELWIIDGLEAGRIGLLAKIHHCIADGVTGARMLASMFSTGRSDTSRPSRPPPPPREEPPTPLPSEADLLRDALKDRAQVPRELSELGKRTQDALRKFMARRAEPERRQGATPFDAPRVAWNAPIAAERSVAFAHLPAAHLKTIRKTLGATQNDVVLAICAGALRRYLEAHSALPLAPLLAACPVNARGRRGTGQNRVSVMFISLATNLADARERMTAIRASSRGAKEELGTFGSEMVGNWAELLAPGVLSAITHSYTRLGISTLHRPIYNVSISNVPGPPVPLFLGGAKLAAAYPMGPVIEGVGLNITAMTYVDRVDFGITAASSVMDDLNLLAEQFAPACAELLALVSEAPADKVAETR
jgi:WS/DGAT/MGAT family acyltransferase